MWFSTSSRVSWLQVWKQVHLWQQLRVSTCWWWGETQQEVEEREYSRSSCDSERKKRSKVVYLKIQIQRSLLYGKIGQPRSNASAGNTIKFSGRSWYEIQFREWKVPSQSVIQKGEFHERNPCAPKFEERTLEETSRQEECARKAAWILRKIFKLKSKDKTTFYSLVEIKAPVLGLKISCLCGQDVKHRRVIIGILPWVVVTSLETDAIMAIVACFDMLMMRRNPPRGREKKGTQGAVAILKGKKGPRLSISELRSNEFYSTENWRIGIERFGGTHHEILRMHLVRN